MRETFADELQKHSMPKDTVDEVFQNLAKNDTARYIDADALLKKILYGNSDSIVLRGYAAELVKAMPTADVVAVVRCKDCKHKVLTSDGEYNPEDIVCDYFASDGFCENDFCSYGERIDKTEYSD